MAWDWCDQDRADEWQVELVDPHDATRSRGELRGVTSAKVSYVWDAEGRASATVETLAPDGDDGWVEASRLRVWHVIREWGWREALFCGYVKSRKDEWTSGGLRATYELGSALWAMSADLWTQPFAVGAGGTVRGAVGQVMSSCGRDYRLLAGAGDLRFTTSRVWQAGSSKLATLTDLCSLAGSRLDVDGMGLPTVGPARVPTASDAARWTLDASGPGSVVVSSVEHSSTAGQVPGRYVVTHKEKDNVTVGVATADASNPASAQRRGFTIAETEEVTDLPGGQAQANQLAAEALEARAAADEEWRMTCLYFPARPGDACRLRLGGAANAAIGTRACYVREVDADCLAGTMDITLRGCRYA